MNTKRDDFKKLLNFERLLFDFLNGLPRQVKSFIFLAIDLILVVISFYFAFALRLNDPWPEVWLTRSLPLLSLLLSMAVIFFWVFRLHRTKLVGYEARAVARSGVWVASLVLTGVFGSLILNLDTPRTVPFIFGSILFFWVFGSRYFAINFLKLLRNQSSVRQPIAIYGAGEGGIQMVSALRKSAEYKPKLFVDDNRNLHGLIISGLKVHAASDLPKYIQSGKIKQVFLAIPSLSIIKKKTLLEKLQNLECEVMELPSYVEIVQSGGYLRNLRPVSTDALLGRDGVDLRSPEVEDYYAGANILVSGAGGSIGSELCRKLLLLKPKKLVLLDISEISLYQVDHELRPIAEQQGVELVQVLANVLDRKQVTGELKKHSIDTILHAAAYKHVPMIEGNEVVGVFNNTIGTKTLAELAIENNVARFLMVSTDKAVRPTNVMGASKRLAELIINDFASENSNTVFSIVRFGNVLDSSGSVVPLFKNQISNGGPITLTHTEVTRYFMTIPEAASLVLLAATYAEDGDVFLLDMGEPVKIYDLAKQMIKLSGLTVKDDETPDGDIAIQVTGLRPGEKLYEELLIDPTNLSTPHPKILRAKESALSKAQLKKAMKQIQKAIELNDDEKLRKYLEKWVDGYQPTKHQVPER